MAIQPSSRKGEANSTVSDSPSIILEPIIHDINSQSLRIYPVTLPTDSFREVLKPQKYMPGQPNSFFAVTDTTRTISNLNDLIIATDGSWPACITRFDFVACPTGTFVISQPPITHSLFLTQGATEKLPIPPTLTTGTPLYESSNEIFLVTLMLRQLNLIYMMVLLTYYLIFPICRGIYFGLLSWIDFITADEFVGDMEHVVDMVRDLDVVIFVERMMEDIFGARVRA